MGYKKELLGYKKKLVFIFYTKNSLFSSLFFRNLERKKKISQGAGLAVLTCTYGFKLFEAAVLRRGARGGKGGGGEGEGEGKRPGAGHGGGGDVEKGPPKGRDSSKEEEEEDSVRAGASVSGLGPKELGEPGFGGRRNGAGGRGRKGENHGGGGDKEGEEQKKIEEKSDSFDSAMGCFDREQ